LFEPKVRAGSSSIFCLSRSPLHRVLAINCGTGSAVNCGLAGK